MRRRVRSVIGVAMLAAPLAGVLAAAGAPAASPRHVSRARGGTVFAPAAVTANPIPAGTGTAANRYSLVHGCFAIASGGQPLASADAPFRMQATALGRIPSGRVAWVAAITAFDARRVSRIRADVRASGLR